MICAKPITCIIEFKRIVQTNVERITMERISFKSFREFQRFVFVFCFSYFISYWISLTIIKRPGRFCQNNKTNLQHSLSSIDSINMEEDKDKFLFVAVMTTRKFLETRADAVYNTWGHRVPGKIVFFVGGKSRYKGNLPVVVLGDVEEETYPPQKKSFAMLNYVATHYIEDYEWFMRVDDDVFVKIDRLERFLRSCNNLRLLYMGQPGTGVPKEKGKLGLFKNSSYCLGGPGVVFTPSTLRILAQYLPQCLNNTVTLHEDTELGRCVQKHVGLACTNAYEFGTLFHQNNNWKNGTSDLKLGSVEDRALTLHPLKKQSQMYHVEKYFTTKRLKYLERKREDMSRSEKRFNSIIVTRLNGRGIPFVPKSSEIRKRLRELEGWSQLDEINLTNNSSGLNKERPRGEMWDFIKNRKSIFSRYNIYSSELSLHGKQMACEKALEVVNKDPRYHGKKVAPFTYQRLSFGTSMENIVPILLSPKSSISVRTVQTFQDIEFIENDKLWKNPSSVENPPKISMIVPLYKRSKKYAAFLSSLTRALEKYHGKIDLHVLLYVDKEKEFENSKKYSKTMNNFLNKLNIKLSVFHEPFSRGKGINKEVRTFANDSLLLIIDVDIFFDEKFLNRVILNTIRGKQVFFPIIFSQYNPNITCHKSNHCKSETVNFDNEYGTWRFFSFGILSIYKEDFFKLKGFKGNIKGWGKEDVEFFNDCLKSNLRIFRTADPYLVHVYHHRDCDPSLPKDQLKMCLASRYLTYGEEHGLFEISSALNLLRK